MDYVQLKENLKRILYPFFQNWVPFAYGAFIRNKRVFSIKSSVNKTQCSSHVLYERGCWFYSLNSHLHLKIIYKYSSVVVFVFIYYFSEILMRFYFLH